MSEESWTVGRLLNWTTDFLRERDADSPRLDAEVLLAHARGCQRIELYTAFEEPAEEPLREQFRALVKQRAAGKPVAYLVGHREFFSLSFRVTPDVLIPRPETEQMVVRSLDLVKSQAVPLAGEQLHLADLGTGSGVLAVSLAKHIPNSLVAAVDISPAALEVARTNAQQHEVSDRIKFIEGDLFANVAPGAQFGLVVSNPPYVLSEEMAELSPNVRDYEPALALDGGEQGTDVISRLVPTAVERLLPGGWLLIEISPTTAAATEQLIDEHPALQRQATLKDLADLPRVVQAQRIDS